MQSILASLSAALLLFVGCQMDREPIADIAAEAPDNVTVLLANPYVQVAEYRLAPGEGLPLHAGGPRLVYSLSDYKLLWTEQGQETEQGWSTGQVHWHDAVPHEALNVGTTEARYLVVTRLSEPLPPGAADVTEDVADTSPKLGKVVLTNDIMRLIQVTLPSGQTIPMHNGHFRVIYPLTDYTLEFEDEGGEKSIATYVKGKVLFHARGRHAVTNTGDTDARYLVFGLRK